MSAVKNSKLSYFENHLRTFQPGGPARLVAWGGTLREICSPLVAKNEPAADMGFEAGDISGKVIAIKSLPQIIMKSSRSLIAFL